MEARLAELESRRWLFPGEITIEELNVTVTAHEMEMAKLRDHLRLPDREVKKPASRRTSRRRLRETPPPHY
ncbi:SlyX family protein [Escherichia coli]|nr:SlyX family protein [Escherichia coli]